LERVLSPKTSMVSCCLEDCIHEPYHPIHPSLTWDSQIKILTRIYQNEAPAVVNNTLFTKYRDNNEISFGNITIKDIRSVILMQDNGEFKAYLKLEEYKEDIVVEILYHLVLKVFGSDHTGNGTTCW
jgi:hypothetical protein